MVSVGLIGREPPHPIINSEVTPRSHNKDPEYCLLSEECNEGRRNPKQILALCLWAPPEPQGP
jgi:hypothetical protein